MKHHHEAVDDVHREKPPDGVIEDRLAAQQEELLGLPVREPHAPAIAGRGDDHPKLFGLLFLHVRPPVVGGCYSSTRVKIILPDGLCSTLVTSALTREPTRAPAASTTIIVPSSR